MSDYQQYMILDDTGVQWQAEEEEGEGKDEAMAILDAVEAGNEDGYREALGTRWEGDLVLVLEVRRSTWVRRDPYA